MIEADDEDPDGGEDQGDFLGGRLLVAMPGIDDPRFEHAVILICAHTDDYATGVRLNEPMDGVSLPDLLRRLGFDPSPDLPAHRVLTGGPVERERGFVLHSTDYAAPESTLPISDTVSLTTTREVLETLAGGGPSPHLAVMALGRARWAPGQLEQELRGNVWLTCEADEGLIFDEAYDTKWERALAKIGVSAAQLSVQTGRA